MSVSATLLSYLRNSVLQSDATAPFSDANCVITVPASFDEVARTLTLEAAREAGLGEVVLLEEPQAAFYAWLASQGTDWRKQVQAGDLLLVCDVGGGTADFSLIEVIDQGGDLQLERIAVGDHLLLGGDNMDLALAHAIHDDLQDNGTSLDDWQFASLVQSVRQAKETLLAETERTDYPLAIPGRGSRLLGSTVSALLTRDQLQSILLDGFFPLCQWHEQPQMRRQGGLRESGLPYAADAALSKHLARFLAKAYTNKVSAGTQDGSAKNPVLLPDKVLFNGGVFNSALLRTRVLNLLSSWAEKPVLELQGAAPDHAVALGAAVYARMRSGGSGLRIKSGTARSYYIGMETSAMAVPGRKPKVKALCVAPQGMEEGTSTQIGDQEFFLYTGEFPSFGSSNPTFAPPIRRVTYCPTLRSWRSRQGSKLPFHHRKVMLLERKFPCACRPK
ncbi:MAG: Hsp70 family protein [Verrucomicrobia bacterium]|nr:Hsp70 family protein [Verrucomicrobiota bacterium]